MHIRDSPLPFLKQFTSSSIEIFIRIHVDIQPYTHACEYLSLICVNNHQMYLSVYELKGTRLLIY
jgi:hypothetical protein